MSNEFDFIEKIRQRAAGGSDTVPDLRLGIGDDTAILGEETGRETLITVDLLVEEIDFRLDYAIPGWLGHKTLAVSLSDIAAMGGNPRFALLSLGIPPRLIPRQPDDERSHFWEEFFDGYFGLAHRHGVSLIGGDISATPDRLSIDSIVLGHCRRGAAIRRNGARVGEAIYLTGEVGAAASGLHLLLAGQRANPAERSPVQEAIRAQLAPQPRVEMGRALGRSGLVSAMIDVSDGLAQDLGHLCAESRVGALINLRQIPVCASLDLLGLESGERFTLAVSGGEDFELLFTAPPEVEQQLRKMAGPSLRLSRIGTIVEGAADQSPIMLEGDGPLRPLAIHGHNHFAGGSR